MTPIKELIQVEHGCSLPWLHAEISMQNNNIRPCCKYTNNSGQLSSGFKNVWFAKQLTDLRSDFTNNVTNNGCNACVISDDAFSYKNWKNESYIKLGLTVNSFVEKVELPKVFHISLKNVCNLACRMCKPTVSSTFENIVIKSEVLRTMYDLTPPSNDFQVEHLAGSFVNARHITITGGEPLVDKDCLTLISMIQQESKNLKIINFATNMTKLNHALLEKLSQLDAYVSFSVSIDGPRNIHEYIRYGCDWDKIISNLKLIRKMYPTIKFAANTTVSALNAGYLPETLIALQDMEKETGVYFKHLMASPVFDPAWLHPSILPQQIKELYFDKLSAFDDSVLTTPDSKLLIPTAIAMMQQQPTVGYDQFEKFINEFDRVANTELTTTYPEFKMVLK